MKDDYSGKSYGGGSKDVLRLVRFHDHMPAGPKMLHVMGKCKFPTTGLLLAHLETLLHSLCSSPSHPLRQNIPSNSSEQSTKRILF